MSVALIVAMSDDGVIGRAGGLPWRLSSDLRRFKQITMGHALVMGRKTYESIGRPLPGRLSIVISRQAGYAPSGEGELAAERALTPALSQREREQEAAPVLGAHSLEEALKLAADREHAFVIGGGEIFKMALPLIERLYLTRVHGGIAGDVHFDLPDLSGWNLVERSEHPTDVRNEYATTFEVYERVLNSPR